MVRNKIEKIFESAIVTNEKNKSNKIFQIVVCNGYQLVPTSDLCYQIEEKLPSFES